MVIVIGLILLGYVLSIVFNKKVDILNPSTIFSLLILGTYFISTLRLSLLQSVYPLWFSVLILLMIFMFYLGNKSSVVFKQPNTELDIHYFPSTMKTISFIFWLAIMVSFAMMVNKLGLPPALSKGNRAEYFISGWGTIVILQSSFFALLMFDRFNKNALKSFFWIYSVSIFILAVLLSNKFQIIYMIILYIVARHSYKKQIKISTLIKLSLVIVFLFALLFEFVYEDMYGVSLQAMQLGYRMVTPEKLSFLTQPYLYVAFNYENLFNFLNSETHTLFGLRTFSAFIDILHLESLYPQSLLAYVEEWKSLLKINSLTTGTMFQDFAQDGGIIWMIICTYFCGLWSGVCYRRFKVNKNFISFFLYAASTVAIFTSFFSNVFTSKVTILNLIVSILIGLILQIEFVFRRL
ncbi:O-antigen polymerase [Streptococcus caprae]|uniref:O-antigen polymerase n=1 Tax=Streptococcus caprae TaxID=1640501 RepID=A0ABV8CTI0_9STRE